MIIERKFLSLSKGEFEQMEKVSGNAVDTKSLLQNTNNNNITITVLDKNKILSPEQKQEMESAYIVDIKNEGKKSMIVSGIGKIEAIENLKVGPPGFCVTHESLLARRVCSAVTSAETAAVLHTYNPYESDEFFTPYIHLEENIKKGGEKAIASYNKAFADIEASVWKKFSHKEKTLSDDLHKYMDGLQRNTGVNVTNSYVANGGHDYDIQYRYGGNVCDISKNMLEFMQSHQEHQDIWQNVVKGKYDSFDGIVDALNESGDVAAGSSLKNLESNGDGTPATFIKAAGGEMWAEATGYTDNPYDI